MKQGLVIWGARGHALVVADIIRLVNAYQIIGMIDDMNPESQARSSPDTRCWVGAGRSTVSGRGKCGG